MRKKRYIIYCWIFVLLFTFSGFSFASQGVGKKLKTLPVQSGGRVKPFDTFARESLRFIYGKTQFNKKPAVDVLMSWTLLPEYWHKEEFIQVRDSALRKTLKLSEDKVLFSPKALLQNKIFIQEIMELQVKQRNKEPLDDYFKSVQKLENRLILYQAFQKGEIPGWIPFTKKPEKVKQKESSYQDNTADRGRKAWLTLSQWKDNTEEHKLFKKIIVSYVSAVSSLESSASDKEKKTQNLKTAIFDFKHYLSLKYPEYKRSLSKVSIELHYNQLNPFRLAWIFYLVGFLLLFSHWVFRRKFLFYGSLAVLAGAFCLQGYGMILRSLIMGRPPVTNMYETVIWVPWVAVIFGAFLWFRHRVFTVFACACAVALLCLLLADSAPSLLDGRLEPLEAVLRSNFWLTTHVLIITMSYSAFFLAFALGDVLLFLFLRQTDFKKVSLSKRLFFRKNDRFSKLSNERGKSSNQEGTQDKIRMCAKCIDRSLQAGVVLLAAGTILGGIWADYSWGRFWGWDPKETWALISLLGYVALLHGRLVGWVKEFGLAVGAVLVFFLIVMAWYGVNYVLGQGLHSYGFGSGGVEYVSGFAILHLMYVILVWTLRPFGKVQKQ